MFAFALQLTWTVFPIVTIVYLAGIISTDSYEIANLVCHFFSKVGGFCLPVILRAPEILRS